MLDLDGAAEIKAEHVVNGVGVSEKIPTWDNEVGSDLKASTYHLTLKVGVKNGEGVSSKTFLLEENRKIGQRIALFYVDHSLKG